jgi:hypothetical protein
MDQQQLKIWFAGFYEGEGSISNDISNRNRLRISIAQNDRTPLDIGKKIWGGWVRERIRKSPASDKICKGHEWQLNHCDSLKFIEDIKPFMMIPYKIQQVKKCEDLFKQEWNGKFKCSFCESVFTDIPGKKRHEKIIHIEKGVLHKCTLCEKTYLSLDSMKRHIKINHNSVASVCDEQMQHTLQCRETP